MLLSGSAATLETLSTGVGRSLNLRGLSSGLKLGESALLHAGVYSDIGFDTNVLYTADNTKSSPVLHVGTRLELNNAERDGTKPSGAYYDVFALIDWRKYLSDNEAVTQQDAISPSAGALLELSSGQAFSFILSDSFTRYQQAPYSAGDPLIRDINLAAAALRFAPGGGRLRLTLRYANLIDAYEAAYSGGSNMGNEVLFDAGWRWLPKTSLYVQITQGVVSYFEGDRPTSYPLRTMAGLRGLLTEKLALNLGAGYSNGFYSSGPNPSGLGNVGIVAELSYTIDLLSRAGFGYRHDFINSPFVGQFYYMDAIYAAYHQMVASRVLAYVFGRYENRRFVGAADALSTTSASRTDNYLMAGVALDYVIARYFQIGASYTVGVNRTDLSGGTTGGIDYTKQTILFRLAATY